MAEEPKEKFLCSAAELWYDENEPETEAGCNRPVSRSGRLRRRTGVTQIGEIP